MLVRVRCQRCGSRFRVKPEWAGRKGNCPNAECGAEFVVPRMDPEQLERLALQASGRGASSAAEADAVLETVAPAKGSEPAPKIPAAARPARSKSSAPRRSLPAEETSPARERDVPTAPQLPKRPGARKSVQRRRPSSFPWRWILLAAAFVVTVGSGWFAWRRPSGAGGSPTSALLAADVTAAVHERPFSEVRPFFEKFCFDCHSGAEAEGGFAMEKFADTAAVQGDRRRWERVYKLLKVGNMPPADVDQPSEEQRAEAVAWLDRTLFYVDCSVAQDPGRVTVRRLNRNEYNHTIRDLVGVDFEPAADFPSDDVGYGFDNIGDVLTVPPLLIEKYLAAAEEIAARAILTKDPDYLKSVSGARELRSEGAVHDREDAKALVSRGTVSRRITFPRKGEYVVRIEASADQAGPEPAKMEVEIEGSGKRVFDIRGQRQQETYEFKIQVDEGRRRVGATFINDYYNEKEKADRNLYVHSIGVEGPFGVPVRLPESHQRLIAATPGGNVSPEEAARRNLQPLVRRAFRRPVSDRDLEPYVQFVSRALQRGEKFERGMQVALQAVLVSPEFLFRVETPGGPKWDGRSERITDHELATRLSYFLWASLPDDELFAAAEAGRLQQPDVLEAQVRRMLQDPRSERLVSSFAGQWLGLRKLATNEVAPDPAVFPDFNDQVRRDLWLETERFFGAIVREDRRITDLINGRYTFVNERLAKLYGIPGVQGEEFRQVDVDGSRRSGIVTHGSILTLTSYPTRTSPVKRGEWVLSNLLGDAPPEPPPVVPALDETQKAHPDLSLREQLVLHRADPGCASCHVVMDEIGFGLENFDAIGRWRDKDGPHPINPVGTLPGGETFSGPAELVAILSQRQDDFTRCLAEKLLTYALGRGLEYYDRCTINNIVQRTRESDYRFSALVLGIVSSDPFQKRRASGP